MSKASSKGISKRLNELTADVYKSVLQTQQPFTGVNRGFIRKERQMVTYKQSRAGITYYYVKRQVLEDGVSTTPLDMRQVQQRRFLRSPHVKFVSNFVKSPLYSLYKIL